MEAESIIVPMVSESAAEVDADPPRRWSLQPVHRMDVSQGAPRVPGGPWPTCKNIKDASTTCWARLTKQGRSTSFP